MLRLRATAATLLGRGMNHALHVTSFDHAVLKALADGGVITLDIRGKLRLNGERLHATTWSALLSAHLIARVHNDLPITAQGNGYTVTAAGRNLLGQTQVLQ
jgi:hypothetical protein